MNIINPGMQPKKMAVVGAGSWGTTIAYILAAKGIDIELWAYETDVVREIEQGRENQTFLPGVKLPDRIHPTNSLEEAVSDQDIIVMVVPSHVMRQILDNMKSYVKAGAVLCNATKGIENDTLLTMTQLMAMILPEEAKVIMACLSGPSFAREVSRNLPTAVTIASHDRDAALWLQQAFSSPNFRAYTSNDLVGVELGGSLKNIYAIAAGISDGLNLGHNTRAALITRGLAEMSRLGIKMGADPMTFMGLAGLGDLVLTCTGDLSRNRTVGLKIGAGQTLKNILSEMKMVAEGVKTTRSTVDLARREGVEMPIAEQLHEILYQNKEPWQGLIDIMTRDLKDEFASRKH